MVEDAQVISQFCRTMATDFRLLADLHALELTAERMAELKEIGFPEVLALNTPEPTLTLAMQQMTNTLSEWPNPIPQTLVDELATDFADIYLNGKFHGAPSESVWIDDEELVCQQPMFQVRDWYSQHGLAVPNWRLLADDHLVNELLFVAYLLDKAAGENEFSVLEETARFMDEHLLRWLLPFGQRVASRCSTAYYASLALITALYAEQLRDLLANVLEQPRPSHEEMEARMRAKQLAAVPAQPVQYYPGLKPSW